MRWLPDLADVSLLLGAALVVAGVALIDHRAGVILLGVLLCLIPIVRKPHGPAR